MFYMSRVLGTNVLIALNKLIESKSINGVMLLPPAQLEATEANTLLARRPLRLRMLNATYCTPSPAGLHLLHPKPCRAPPTAPQALPVSTYCTPSPAGLHLIPLSTCRTSEEDLSA